MSPETPSARRLAVDILARAAGSEAGNPGQVSEALNTWLSPAAIPLPPPPPTGEVA